MPYTVHERVQRWALESDSEEINFQNIYDIEEYFAAWRYCQYLPTVGPYPDFRRRLRDWLDGLPNEIDQKCLFRLIPHIFFVTYREYSTLYRTAFNGVIAQWLINTAGIGFNAEDLNSRLELARRETWFCPITDSMEIAAFYHVNRIEGQDLRPNWSSLEKLGSRDNIIAYMRQYNLKRLVLLEDFVGSGSQVSETLRFAASISSDIPVLAVPLIICPEGEEQGKRLMEEFSNLQFMPIVSLPAHTLLNKVPVANEPNSFGPVRELVRRISDLISGNPPGSKYYGPFGYRETGALVVTYSNCPDNTLPIIRYDSKSWKALFPRSSRI